MKLNYVDNIVTKVFFLSIEQSFCIVIEIFFFWQDYEKMLTED